MELHLHFPKVVKSSSRNRRGQTIEGEDLSEGGSDGVVSLFGRWQTEPLCLPPAVDGIVPKVGLLNCKDFAVQDTILLRF